MDATRSGSLDSGTDVPGVESASQPFVGRWNHLVSNTNWEKGRIIFQWREALVSAEAPASEHSDDAWSRRVGGITAQHVGRLRRVSQRFGTTYSEYDGLFWSHFQAALDWDDAEMWLEGAVQNGWPVSQMRRNRWETLGAVAEQEPREDEVVTSELDEDFEPAINSAPDEKTVEPSYSEVQAGPRPDGPDFGDEEDDRRGGSGKQLSSDEDPQGAAIYADENDRETIEFVQPFANLAELPEDLGEAFESYKLAILRHKSDDWAQITRDDMLGTLEALKQLVLAPG
jgi:hypothetical protein